MIKLLWLHLNYTIACTLHAEKSTLNKLLWLHRNYSYSIVLVDLDACIEQTEGLLSKMGFHGGHVCIRKDESTSGVLVDVCMAHVKAIRFLYNHDNK